MAAEMREHAVLYVTHSAASDIELLVSGRGQLTGKCAAMRCGGRAGDQCTFFKTAEHAVHRLPSDESAAS
jgi:hypothetical protein